MKSELSDSEFLIMEYLWKYPEGKTFAEIQDYLCSACGKEWKKQTVNTFLSRMIDKELVKRVKVEKHHRYLPLCDVTEYRQLEAKLLLDRNYGGSLGTFVSALAGSKGLCNEQYEELMHILKGE